MRWSALTILLIPLMVMYTKADWSWNEDGHPKPGDQTSHNPGLQGQTVAIIHDHAESNSTVLDDIVDELVTSKQGRSLGGFDDVYQDPTIKQALDAGDDGEAKNLIKERLCTLGLVQCDEATEEKRYLSPEEVIYAQPVDIKPIGKPVASIPLRGVPRAYGPPQHVPYPGRPQKLPPKRVGYPGVRPGFSDKYGLDTGNYQYAQNSASYAQETTNFVTKSPIYASPPSYPYDNTKPSYTKPSAVHGSKTDATVQQHIHHHYVHSDGEHEPKVIIKPVAIPVGSVGNLATQTQFQHSSDRLLAAGSDYNGFSSESGFKPMPSPFVESNNKQVYEADTVYGSHYGHNANKISANVLNQGLPSQFSNNAFGEHGNGNGLGDYANQNKEFYKKELLVGGSLNNNNLYSQGPATFDQSNGYTENYHEGKAQGLECVCVNFDQCPSQEIIGRRDDLYLPIDPRNKGSEIAALSDDQLDTVNKTEATDNTTETKKVNKREATDDIITAESEKQIEPRNTRLHGYGGQNVNNFGGQSGNDNNKNVQPTFGISFGLPPRISDGISGPYNPQFHPWGHATHGGGINLGLASVNPLISLQVTKDELGEKVYKPLVHFHITPSHHKLHAIHQLFQDKKHYLINKHQHYHTVIPPPVHPVHPGPYHVHPAPHPVYPPQYPQYPPPHYHIPHYAPPAHTPSNFGPPVYSPHFDNYVPHHFKEHDSDLYDQPGPNPSYPEDGYENDDVDPHHTISYNNYDRSANLSIDDNESSYTNRKSYSRSIKFPLNSPGANRGYQTIRFPEDRKKRDVENVSEILQERQAYYGRPPVQQCKPNQVCCRRPLRPQAANKGQCGIRHSQGINGRIKTPAYVDGESEFGEYPWQAAILKKDPKESVYVCGGTLIDGLHIITAAHCIKSYKGFELRIRLGEWDVNRDVEFYPYIERDVISVHVHPLYYAGTLDNDLAILKMDHPVEWTKYPHISPACLPDKYTDYSGQRCWTTGWGKDAFGDYGKYQNILKEVDVPVIGHNQCQQQLRQTRLGYNYELNPGFICAGGEDGKDACKGDGGGPLVCERSGTWQVVGVVSWGIGCGQRGVPGVYVNVAQYLDWISQVTGKYSHY